jgi:hypothetical protein
MYLTGSVSSLFSMKKRWGGEGGSFGEMCDVVVCAIKTEKQK